MAETDKQGRPLVTVVRVIEYHGTHEWISQVLQASRVPLKGELRISPEGIKFPEGTFIRGGLVDWVPAEDDMQVAQPGPPVIPIPPGGDRTN